MLKQALYLSLSSYVYCANNLVKLLASYYRKALSKLAEFAKVASVELGKLKPLLLELNLLF